MSSKPLWDGCWTVQHPVVIKSSPVSYSQGEASNTSCFLLSPWIWGQGSGTGAQADEERCHVPWKWLSIKQRFRYFAISFIKSVKQSALTSAAGAPQALQVPQLKAKGAPGALWNLLLEFLRPVSLIAKKKGFCQCAPKQICAATVSRKGNFGVVSSETTPTLSCSSPVIAQGSISKRMKIATSHWWKRLCWLQ